MFNSLRRLSFSPFLCLLIVASIAPLARAGEDWLPVSPEELKMADEPKAPGAMAIYLYRQVDRDDANYRETNYARIKIFTEEGRTYADIEIPFVKSLGDIRNIQARTIHPDGSIVNFDGKVYEKTIVKAKGIKYLAKTFSMPDVQVGSIVEYRYTRFLPEGWIYDSQWILSEELFTKHAKFSLRQNTRYGINWSWPRGLPPGTNAPEMKDRVIRLETQDIPAFQIEDYMPPQNEMKYRIDFRYIEDVEKDPAKFWKKQATAWYRGIETFTDKRKAMEAAVAQTVAATDTPEQKLQKIYARCQQIRNTSYEREKTKQELDREKIKLIMNVEDVWKRGYGNAWSIPWLFLAMARAAGFEASPVRVATRNAHFFSANLMNANELDSNVVLVKLNGKDMYFDPGIAFTPFGLLPWSETDVNGLRIEKDGGTWISTPPPDPAVSGIERRAAFELDDSGSLEGKVTFTYKGIAALSRRLEEYEDDDAGRKKYLEDEIKSYVPVVIEAELTNTPDWGSSANTLVAEFHVKIPGWATAAGKRTLLAASVFGGAEKHLFEGANRVHPIYFSYSYADVDDVTITPALGWKIANLPKPENVDVKACAYNLTAENNDGALRLRRNLMVNLVILDASHYPALRAFFQTVRNGDEQQVVLTSSLQ
jgi:hypothetical protein